MEHERLTLLVAEPSEVARGDLKDLHALAERYPWFAGAQVLRSLGEERAGNVRSEETLTTVAAHIPSRSVLFDLVAELGTEQLAPLKVVEKDKEDRPSIEDVSSFQALDIVQEQEVVVPNPIVEGPIAEGSDEEPTTIDPLEAQIMEAAIASAYDLTWEAQVPELKEVATSATVEEVVVPRKEEYGIDLKREPAVALAETKLNLHGARLRFTDWLDQSPSSISRTSVDHEVSVAPSPEHLREDPKSSSEDLVSYSKEPAGTKDLIDRFIQQQTPAPPAKVAFFTPQQAAKRSLDDSSGLVTETLARVYAKQGNLPKAIEAYQKLAIKYPQKSAYFAALAKELEGQLNT